METLRPVDLRLRRRNKRATNKLDYLQARSRGFEKQMAAAFKEAEVRPQKKYDELQLLWEQRDFELKRIISRIELCQAPDCKGEKVVGVSSATVARCSIGTRMQTK